MFRLSEAAHIGYAHLRVTDLNRSLAFYVDTMGLKEVSREGTTVALSATGGPPVHLMLTEHTNAQPKPQRSTGLYHIAIRLPNRAALARLFHRLVMRRVPFGGFSDHGVSEALYLSDPDGNGLELYRDRPRDQWPMMGPQVEMVTRPLDAEALLAEGAAESERLPWRGIDPGADMGHVHLHVSDLKKAESFYVDLLGMDVMQRTYVGALFVAAGGYHHHIGLNVWAGPKAPPPDAVGLEAFSIVVGDRGVWDRLLARLREAGVTMRTHTNGSGAGVFVQDQDGNAVELVRGV